MFWQCILAMSQKRHFSRRKQVIAVISSYINHRYEIISGDLINKHLHNISHCAWCASCER